MKESYAKLDYKYNLLPLSDYGLDLLNERSDIFEDFDFNNIYDIRDVIFEYAYMDGSLTYNSHKAQEEVFDNYSFSEVLEFLRDKGFSLDQLVDDGVEIERIHIYLCEHEFVEYFYNISDNFEINLSDIFTDKELLLISLYDLSNIHELTNLQKVLEKEIVNNEKLTKKINDNLEKFKYYLYDDEEFCFFEDLLEEKEKQQEKEKNINHGQKAR